MAQKAEEYGSHDKTFEIPTEGKVQVVNKKGTIIFEHSVESGDIWRMCQTRDVAVKDWVKLAYKRAKITGNPTIFWLDEHRAHDANLIKIVNENLKEYDMRGKCVTLTNNLFYLTLQYFLFHVFTTILISKYNFF
jgi:isocitrate dehydrogenase